MTENMTDLVIFDLEYTSWPGSLENNWSNPGEYREIVQIGAVRLSVPGLTEQSAFNNLVAPERNPVLSNYFTALTGITNEQITKNGIPFDKALTSFLTFCDGATMASYGDDRAVIMENTELHDVPLSRSLPPFLDLAPWFADLGVNTKQVSSNGLPAHFGLHSAEKHHDALGDARAIAMALRHLIRETEDIIQLMARVSLKG